MSQPIKIGEKKLLYMGQFIHLWGTEFFDKKGRPGIWEWIEKNTAVLVFPVTEDGNVVLIKNFRIPLGKYVIEVPAGLSDRPDETPQEVAKRELFEETGYVAERFIEVPSWPYRAGSSNGMMKAFIALEARKVKENVVGDDLEDITVMEVPLDELVELYFYPPDGVLFQPEILALHQMAQYIGY